MPVCPRRLLKLTGRLDGPPSFFERTRPGHPCQGCALNAGSPSQGATASTVQIPATGHTGMWSTLRGSGRQAFGDLLRSGHPGTIRHTAARSIARGPLRSAGIRESVRSGRSWDSRRMRRRVGSFARSCRGCLRFRSGGSRGRRAFPCGMHLSFGMDWRCRTPYTTMHWHGWSVAGRVRGRRIIC